MIRKMLRRVPRWILLLSMPIILAGLAVGGYGLVKVYGRSQTNSIGPIQRWFREPASHPELITIRNGAACPDAPFILPSDGLVGLLWGDPAGPYTIFNRHAGIDIFGDGLPGEVPVYAAYDGYLTRLPDWFATVIIRHDDPLQPGRTIWTYYTHMGARDGSVSYIAAAFPPGASDVPVKQGTLLGYQGEYAGADSAVGMHVHFSVVLSGEDGSFLNETRQGNTLDPSPYLGMPVNIAERPARPIMCITPGGA